RRGGFVGAQTEEPAERRNDDRGSTPATNHLPRGSHSDDLLHAVTIVTAWRSLEVMALARRTGVYPRCPAGRERGRGHAQRKTSALGEALPVAYQLSLDDCDLPGSGPGLVPGCGRRDLVLLALHRRVGWLGS